MRYAIVFISEEGPVVVEEYFKTIDDAYDALDYYGSGDDYEVWEVN